MIERTTAICLSVYNGGLFLREQLDSILQHDETPIKLIIRDDGSGDISFKILNQYKERYEDKIELASNSSGNIGCQQSFMSLIWKSTQDYIMLSDQDDVWKPDKISMTIKKMSEMEIEHGSETPLLVFTDLTVTDIRLDILDKSFWHFQKIDPTICYNWKKLLAQNVVTGCTIMINKAAKRVIFPFALDSMLHDHWIAVNIAKHGYVDFINDQTVFYRQHSHNLDGAKKYGPLYAFKKIVKIYKNALFYWRAMNYFGNVSMVELFYYKATTNIKRLIDIDKISTLHRRRRRY
ncbi:MAG: glycosyltransferase [Desulfuromonadales bacterium]|nr:glycosyltransferase [Desulfuromonadales bacterium]